MADTPFIKFYPSDFLGGTSGLSPAERGVYITLLCLIYENGAPVVCDEVRLARRCGAPKATFKRIFQALINDQKLTLDDGCISNKRAEKALIDRRNRVQNSTHAANSKWNAQGQKTQRKQGPKDAAASSTHCVADAKPEARSQIEKETSELVSKKPKRATSIDAGWIPTEADAMHALQKQFSPAEIQEMADGFRDYHLAKGSTFKDWAAAWRTWVGNARKFGGGRKASGHGTSGNRPEDAIVAEVFRRRTA